LKDKINILKSYCPLHSFVIYRLPNTRECTLFIQNESAPDLLSSLKELNGKEGFIIHPFVISDECPAILLHPNKKDVFKMSALTKMPKLIALNDLQEETDGEQYSTNLLSSYLYREQYHRIFTFFMDPLREGSCQKIVLARKKNIPIVKDCSPESLFKRACLRFPKQFIALFYTPQTGCWLTATPEMLLKIKNLHGYTMALAGTQSYPNKVNPRKPNDIKNSDRPWDNKNIEEQRFVSDYITRSLENFSTSIHIEKARSTQAGGLVHLQSDINFIMKDNTHIGDLLDALHPTPAVCGVPMNFTKQYILSKELFQRKYYSGFLGYLSPHDETGLYVNLRCMQISRKTFSLYAGGGLLPASQEQDEWEETERKMQTMYSLLNL